MINILICVYFEFLFNFSLSLKDIAAAMRQANTPCLKPRPRQNKKRAKRTTTTMMTSVTRNISRMVIFSSFFNIAAELPFSLFYMLATMGVAQSIMIWLYNLATILLYMSPALDICIYYSFNSFFQNVVHNLVDKTRATLRAVRVFFLLIFFD